MGAGSELLADQELLICSWQDVQARRNDTRFRAIEVSMSECVSERRARQERNTRPLQTNLGSSSVWVGCKAVEPLWTGLAGLVDWDQDDGKPEALLHST